jgi:hypothetical protein
MLFKKKEEQTTPVTGFQALLNSMMRRRWFITALVLGSFMFIVGGIFIAIELGHPIAGEWKELLLLMLGAFIGSYGKIIDYWFSDTDKDKMLVQKMDEEDGVSLSHTNEMKESAKPAGGSLVDPTFAAFAAKAGDSKSDTAPVSKKGTEIDEDGDGVMDGLDFDGDGKIDEYFAHRQCEHVWGDVDGDGDEECVKCGKIKDPE